MKQIKSPTAQLAAKLNFTALTLLKNNGSEMPFKELLNELEKNVELDEWARHVYEKTGLIRWQSIFHFSSVSFVKAEFLIKKKGIWYLTQEGDKALSKGEIGLWNAAQEGYATWENSKLKVSDTPIDLSNDISAQTVNAEIQELTLDEMEARALEGLKDQINRLNPYEFQDLVGALLRAMGYHTPFIAPKGRDGGVDIVAYQDPLGVKTPRIKVQIKHRNTSASVDEVRQLMGLLQRDGDVGMFVSSGGFTSDTKMTARSSQVHVELIDLDRFIELWLQFYSKLDDEDKNRLRLKPIYFYDPSGF